MDISAYHASSAPLEL